ncbi:flavodoxin family protein [Halanaerobiaceae bacterium Z-7014]|uniref:Flavodoxin family protein n=1 Tax=Halonatronomonas betaini TaxID=2778430 RepID=A0A931AUF5_9FIRM|nr:flavodoxin family protein [Halonatronomonas betaini]MBF8438141.1 flavodoxin family protein [Halonatronomonas betaini]
MLNILAIKGSPRSNSNSSFMLDKIIDGCKEKAVTENIEISEKIIKPFMMDIKTCTACFNCDKTAKCVFNDDMTELLKDFDRADIVLLASPIYFNGMPSHIKKMIDRCQPIWASKYVLEEPIIDRDKKRRSVLIGAAGAPGYEDQFIALEKVTSLFFRAINAKKFTQFLYPNTDDNLISEDEESLNKLNQIGKDLISEFVDD